MDVVDKKKTAVQKIEEFCKKEGIVWRAVVVPEEQTSGGGLILKPKVVIEYVETKNDTD